MLLFGGPHFENFCPRTKNYLVGSFPVAERACLLQSSQFPLGWGELGIRDLLQVCGPLIKLAIPPKSGICTVSRVPAIPSRAGYKINRRTILGSLSGHAFSFFLETFGGDSIIAITRALHLVSFSILLTVKKSQRMRWLGGNEACSE